MWEGLATAGLGKAWESVGQLFRKGKDELEAANMKAAASKLTAEAIHLESGTEVQRRQLELAERQSLHERITSFSDPFRAEGARALQDFAKQTSHAFVRLVTLAQLDLERTPATEQVTTEVAAKLLDSFAEALPYMYGDAHSLFGTFFDSVVVCARVVQKLDTVTQRDAAVEKLQAAHAALLPEVQKLVSPLHIYEHVMDAARQAPGDVESPERSDENDA